MAASIRDVARSSGVSVSTVSRALNGYIDVSEKTRKKIQETAQKLGYVPNQSAKNLSSKTKKNIALLISGISEEDKLDVFTGSVLRGVYGYVNGKGMTVATYGITSQIQKEKKLKDMCDEYSLAGIMLLGMKREDPYLKEAETAHIPCVVIDTKLSGENAVTVTTDDEVAFEQITDYVLNRGHKEVVLLAGSDVAEVTHKRYKGFRRSLEKHGLNTKETEAFDCSFMEEIAYRKAKEYIQNNQKSKATAFICMSDLMALGACRAVADCGYSVPEDFSVTGFDGHDFLNYIKPGITTIDQNMLAKGYAGIDALYEMLDGEKVSGTIYVPYKLIVRDSVKNI